MRKKITLIIMVLIFMFGISTVTYAKDYTGNYSIVIDSTGNTDYYYGSEKITQAIFDKADVGAYVKHIFIGANMSYEKKYYIEGVEVPEAEYYDLILIKKRNYTYMTESQALQNILASKKGQTYIKDFYLKDESGSSLEKYLMDGKSLQYDCALFYEYYNPYGLTLNEFTKSGRYKAYHYEITTPKDKVSADEWQQVENKMSQIIAGASGSTYDKIKYLHDYICNNANYDYSHSRHNIYQNLIEGSSVCEGYALAFQYGMERMGLESYLLACSVNGQGHLKNVVALDGQYYYLDCTWDGQDDNLRYNFFLMGLDRTNQLGSKPIASVSYGSIARGSNIEGIRSSDTPAAKTNKNTAETSETQPVTETIAETVSETVAESGSSSEAISVEEIKEIMSDFTAASEKTSKSKYMKIFIIFVVISAISGALYGVSLSKKCKKGKDKKKRRTYF